MPEGGEGEMPVTEVVAPPGASIRSLVPDGWYVVSDAAALVGKSVDTLTRWRKHNIFTPSGFMKAGELKVFLYSDEDIENLRQIATTLKPGRKPQK